MTLIPTPSTASAVLEHWTDLDVAERASAFHTLPPGQDDDLFFSLPTAEQAALILSLPLEERRVWIRALPPDDVADLLQMVQPDERARTLALLDEPGRREVNALLAYAEDEAGGLMSPRFARLRPEMTADEALRYLRRQAQANNLETVYYAYVLDSDQRLLGTLSLRELFAAPGDARVVDRMERDVIVVADDADQETVARVIARHDLLAVPVVDAERRMRGIVTVDDVVDVVQEAATEDIHRLGGLEALEVPYLAAGLWEVIRKRAGWLALLFVGELGTASAMSHYEARISELVVLAVFVPLVISSGGNSGSQAATLITRALALGEVRPGDVLRVVRREVAVGMILGALLGTLGFLRVGTWEFLFGAYGEKWHVLGIALSVSLVGVVLWGTLAGAVLPLLIRRVGLDPASASAPLVSTLVDVSGLLIYFSLASFLLGI